MSGRSWQVARWNLVHTGKLFSLFAGPALVPFLSSPLGHIVSAFSPNLGIELFAEAEYLPTEPTDFSPRVFRLR